LLETPDGARKEAASEETAMRPIVPTATVLLIAASPAWAHPGHPAGAPGISWLHYLTDPYHLLVGALSAVCVGAVVALAVRARHARERARS